MNETLATIYKYGIGITANLSKDEEAELGSILSEWVKAKRPNEKWHTGVVWGKQGEIPVNDFSPQSITRISEAF